MPTGQQFKNLRQVIRLVKNGDRHSLQEIAESDTSGHGSKRIMRLYEYLIEIANEGSARKAADKLGVTVQLISKQFKVLKEQHPDHHILAAYNALKKKPGRKLGSKNKPKLIAEQTSIAPTKRSNPKGDRKKVSERRSNR